MYTHTYIVISYTHTLTSCIPPQTRLRNWSPCYRRTGCPRSLPSPDWFRPWVAMAMWVGSRWWSHWWRISAWPSTCPAWCSSTTRPWHTSRSKTAECVCGWLINGCVKTVFGVESSLEVCVGFEEFSLCLQQCCVIVLQTEKFKWKIL